MPGMGRAMLRGFTLRCPRCGSSGLFRNYFAVKEACPRCGLAFRGDAGYSNTGAMTVLIISTGGLMAVFLFGGLLLMQPDIPVTPLLVICGVIGLLGPIVWWPFANTIWIAFERTVLARLDP